MCADVQKERGDIDQPQSIAQQLLNSAEELRRNDQTPKARQIWATIVDLYADNPSCRQEVLKAKEWLNANAKRTPGGVPAAKGDGEMGNGEIILPPQRAEPRKRPGEDSTRPLTRLTDN